MDFAYTYKDYLSTNDIYIKSFLDFNGFFILEIKKQHQDNFFKLRKKTHSNECPYIVHARAICVQRLDDSRNSAIRITYRISLRSSSL